MNHGRDLTGAVDCQHKDIALLGFFTGWKVERHISAVRRKSHRSGPAPVHRLQDAERSVKGRYQSKLSGPIRPGDPNGDPLAITGPIARLYRQDFLVRVQNTGNSGAVSI